LENSLASTSVHGEDGDGCAAVSAAPSRSGGGPVLSPSDAARAPFRPRPLSAALQTVWSASTAGERRSSKERTVRGIGNRDNGTSRLSEAVRDARLRARRLRRRRPWLAGIERHHVSERRGEAA